jgi:hypothetical protein
MQLDHQVLEAAAAAQLRFQLSGLGFELRGQLLDAGLQ